MNHQHLIDSAIFDIAYSDAAIAAELQVPVDSFVKTDLLQLIDQLFDETADRQNVYRIDRLELDLGDIPSKDYKHVMRQRLRQKLTLWLSDLRDSQKYQQLDNKHFIDHKHAQQEALFYFLQHGYLPWYAKIDSASVLQGVFTDSLQLNPNRMIDFICNSRGHNSITERLLSQFSIQSIQQLARLLSTSPSKEAHNYLAKLRQASPETNDVGASIDIAEDRKYLQALLVSALCSGDFSKLESFWPQLIIQDAKWLEQTLRYYAQQKKLRHQIAVGFSPQMCEQLFALLEPIHYPFILQLISQMQELQSLELTSPVTATQQRQNVVEFTLTYLLVERGSNFNKKSYLGSLIRQMSISTNQQESALLSNLIQQMDQVPRTSALALKMYQLLEELNLELEGCEVNPPQSTVEHELYAQYELLENALLDVTAIGQNTETQLLEAIQALKKSAPLLLVHLLHRLQMATSSNQQESAFLSRLILQMGQLPGTSALADELQQLIGELNLELMSREINPPQTLKQNEYYEQLQNVLLDETSFGQNIETQLLEAIQALRKSAPWLLVRLLHRLLQMATSSNQQEPTFLSSMIRQMKQLPGSSALAAELQRLLGELTPPPKENELFAQYERLQNALLDETGFAQNIETHWLEAIQALKKSAPWQLIRLLHRLQMTTSSNHQVTAFLSRLIQQMDQLPWTSALAAELQQLIGELKPEQISGEVNLPQPPVANELFAQYQLLQNALLNEISIAQNNETQWLETIQALKKSAPWLLIRLLHRLKMATSHNQQRSAFLSRLIQQMDQLPRSSAFSVELQQLIGELKLELITREENPPQPPVENELYAQYELLQNALFDETFIGKNSERQLLEAIQALSKSAPWLLIRLLQRLQSVNPASLPGFKNIPLALLHELTHTLLSLTTQSSDYRPSDLMLSLKKHASTSCDQHAFYRRILGFIARNEAIDFDQLAKAPKEPIAVSPALDIQKEPIQNVPDTQQSLPAETLSRQQAEQILVDQLCDELCLLPRTESAVIRAIEVLSNQQSPRLRQMLQQALLNPELIQWLVEKLPEHILVKLLSLMAVVNSGALLQCAELINNAAARHIPMQQLTMIKWRFIYSYLSDTGYRFNPGYFIRAYVKNLKKETSSNDFELQLTQALLQNRMPVTQPMTRLINESLNIKDNARVSETTLEISEKQSDEPAIVEDIYITNAGLVLVAPYLPRLFEQLGLTEKSAFTNRDAAERAVHMLQFLVNEQSTSPEFEVVLNKLLCGVKAGKPICRGIELSEQEKQQLESLLQAITQHWKALSNTSINGLRESFLQRGGRLKLKDDAWHLSVEPRTFDMLLDQVPWSYSTIKFAWMERVIFVEWR